MLPVCHDLAGEKRHTKYVTKNPVGSSQVLKYDILKVNIQV